MPDLRPSPRRAAARLIQRLRTRGPGEVGRLGLERIADGFNSQHTLLFLVHDTGGDLPPPPEGFEFREATAADAELYATTIGTDSPGSFARRLSDATRCWLVVGDGTIAHASWTTTAAAWTREVGRYFKPPPRDAYIYESFTSPEVRGRGIYPFALASLLATMGREGVDRLWVGVEAHNAPSVRAITKAGFAPAFEVTYGRKMFRSWIGEQSGPLAGAGVTFPRRL